ncbi:hypothetical protein FMEAI12_4760009 [Parafrankia sp. Ea1.12]|nr:hypothetical protein FMEAI12_4760009 [Parafrankia sp. Ea1.12]
MGFQLMNMSESASRHRQERNRKRIQHFPGYPPLQDNRSIAKLGDQITINRGKDLRGSNAQSKYGLRVHREASGTREIVIVEDSQDILAAGRPKVKTRVRRTARQRR